MQKPELNLRKVILNKKRIVKYKVLGNILMPDNISAGVVLLSNYNQHFNEKYTDNGCQRFHW